MSGVASQHSAGPVVLLLIELFKEKSEPSDHIHPTPEEMRSRIKRIRLRHHRIRND